MKSIAELAHLNWQSLDQVLKEVLLPSGKPRALGDRSAEAIEDAYKLGRGWFDAEGEPEIRGEHPPVPATEPKIGWNTPPHPVVKQGGVPALVPRDDDVMVPLSSASASMGFGAVSGQPEVISHMTINRTWLQRHASFTAVENLALLPGHGDSMEPTFEDGDMLLVDRGVNEVKIDAVYVLELNDELFVKRLQRRPNGDVLMLSDNKQYDSYTITEGDRDRFRVLGRVVMTWNARRL